MVAINDWLSYINVRLNSIKVTSGQTVHVKVKPSQVIATETYRQA